MYVYSGMISWICLYCNRGESAWNIAIVVTTAVSLGLILGGLLSGITVVFSHLLYIPVVLSAYRYPRYGLLFSALTGGLYFVMVVLFLGAQAGNPSGNVPAALCHNRDRMAGCCNYDPAPGE